MSLMKTAGLEDVHDVAANTELELSLDEVETLVQHLIQAIKAAKKGSNTS